MHRRGLAFVLAAAMAWSMAVPAMAANNPFPDLPEDHWAYDAVTGLAAAGLIEGYPDGTFGGDLTFTRYEMAQVFSRILKRMENLLSAEIDEKIADQTASLTKQVASAAARAQEALSAALAADNRAGEAQQAASQANSTALQAISTAEKANELAQAAYDLAAIAKQMADELYGRQQPGQAAQETVVRETMVQGGPGQSVGADSTAADEAKAIAADALRVANDARRLAEEAMGKPGPNLTEYQAAVQRALETAQRAEELAKNAVTAEEMAAAQSAIAEAKEAADYASRLAKQAARLEDLAEAMAKAEEANQRALAAQAAADAAMEAAQKPSRYVLDDEARQAIEKLVAAQLVKDLEGLRNDSAALAQRVSALEGKAISAQDAEAIANRIVAGEMAGALGRITSLEQAMDAVKGDQKAIQALVEEKTAALANSVEKLSSEFSAELAAMGVRVSDLEIGQGKLAERVDKLEARQAAQELAVQKLGAEVQSGFSLMEDKIAGNRADISALQNETATMQYVLQATQEDVAATQSDLAAAKSDIAATKSDVTTAKSDIAALQNETATMQYVLQATQEDLASTKADLASTKADLASTKADLAATKSDLAKTNADLAPIKAKFDNTTTGFGADLVVVDAVTDDPTKNNSLFVDPREPLNDAKKAANSDWYNDRVFAISESYLRLAYNLSTVPAPGATLSGSIYAKQDFPAMSINSAGINLDLTTEGTLRSLHLGQLNADQAAAGFNKYILDPAKWDAQLYRINGIQALLQTDGGVSANLLTGHGDVKNVDIANRSSDDLPGSTQGPLAAVSVQVPLGDVMQVRTNWLNLPVTNGNSTAVSAGSLEVFGALGSLNYSATVAGHDQNGPEAGEITIGQQFDRIFWSAEYNNIDSTWAQRMAEPDVDGLTTAVASRNYGVEIGGFKLLDFDTTFAHRYTEKSNDKRNVFMVKGERDLNILLPLHAVAEIGANNSLTNANSGTHAMVDLGVSKWAPFSDALTFDAGYRYELSPILATDWAQRWRNSEIANSPEGVNPATHRNWLLDTKRNASRIQATWNLSDNVAIYAGGKWQTDVATAPGGFDQKANSSVAGLSIQGNVLGAGVQVGYETENDMVKSTLPKQSVQLSVERSLGANALALDLKSNWGQGTDKEYARDNVASLTFKAPVFAGTDLHINGKYAAAMDTTSINFRYSSLVAGLSMAF